MPPRPPINNTVRVSLQQSSTDELGGHEAANIFYVQFSVSGAGTATNLTNLANAIKTAWGTDIAPHMSSDWGLDRVVCTMVDGTEVQGIDTAGRTAGLLSSSSYPPLPPNTAAVASWAINRAYRGGRPRSYQPGITEGQLVTHGSNLMTVGDAENIATGWNNFLVAVNAIAVVALGTITMGVVSYVSNKLPRVTPLFFDYIPGATRCNTRLATQRRRLGKLSVGTYEIA